MQQSDIPISSHIQINACHAWDLHSWIRHLTPERKQELEAAARAARAARGPWDASWYSAKKRNSRDSSWKLDKQMFNHSLVPGAHFALQLLRALRMISNMIKYHQLPNTGSIVCDPQGHLPKNRYAGQRHHSDRWGTSGSWRVMVRAKSVPIVGVSTNGGTSKSSILIYVHGIFPSKPSSYGGTPIYGHPQLRDSQFWLSLYSIPVMFMCRLTPTRQVTSWFFQTDPIGSKWCYVQRRSIHDRAFSFILIHYH